MQLLYYKSTHSLHGSLQFEQNAFLPVVMQLQEQNAFLPVVMQPQESTQTQQNHQSN